MTPVLKAEGLFKSYGAIPVLRDVSLEVAPTETIAIIGPNGAGKTTLFKTLTGEVFPEQGRIAAFGEDVTRMPAAARVALGFGRTFQVARVYPETTLLGNLVLAVETRKRIADERISAPFAFRASADTLADAENWLDAVGLAKLKSMEARFLSHGDKKRLEMALTLALKPKLMMMDEPTAGMSPSDRGETVSLIRNIRERFGVTLLLTEHDMDVVFGLSSQIMVLNYGEVIAMGTGEEIRNNPAVRDVYLGHQVQHA
ncbi:MULTISPECIES: ABC transporter ATP-binding protein [unclassified Chelatococcus]|uniref:ABC transporter ATP-binding protein n=1 Tax=unclassified Chelatococcus TaxID=2638111 RepID=UPI001BCF6CE2|nr:MULTISPECIES: ABC transporter ATP-binding protein [unclassified Chelatococcus]MBS7743454.1 ABC transporter ATP-binding protein [Chelatococcus sp. HY11]MBX3547106.1 ABC transporter ATP-binding protein [Chelatococcus sp.]CAH1663719.1 Amino acid/amide ABC transporter ATP-binding protein 1 (HAAT family) [Hyphomicrobiales bacterium]CAH1687862.1 Amino acid/amide ABC transporter ATP-binding protein 1 (HAAT family) [Hyphomicrobiales bacterium]